MYDGNTSSGQYALNEDSKYMSINLSRDQPVTKSYNFDQNQFGAPKLNTNGIPL